MADPLEVLDKRPDHLQKIAAVVVLYFPDNNVFWNIRSYFDQVDLIILVDNSDQPAIDLVENFSGNDKVISIVNRCNMGIAAALNIGAKEAIAHGCNLLLTMDQDSMATPEMVDLLKNGLSIHSDKPVAIVSPFHLTTVSKIPDQSVPPFEDVDSVWTSGNILSLSAYQIVGPFKEDLFIDFVDHEYCLRLKRRGFRVIQSNRAILQHSIGNNLRKITLASLALIASNHSPLRRYYITRNRLWVAKEYREFKRFCWTDRRRFLAELFTVMLFERQKIEKLKMVVRGYRDYRFGRMGKYCL